MYGWYWLLGMLVILMNSCGVGYVDTTAQGETNLEKGGLHFFLVSDEHNDVRGFRIEILGEGTKISVYRELQPGSLPSHLTPQGAGDWHSFAVIIALP